MVESPVRLPYVTTMNTVLITGCSSGYGLETARYFHSRGWNVIATIRTTARGRARRDEASQHRRRTRGERAHRRPRQQCGHRSRRRLRGDTDGDDARVFETNTFGVMAMTQAVLPAFRTRRSGVVVNVTSSVTLTPMPLAAAYTASKMAIEGFTASLALELEYFNVRVKLVEPGYGPSTRFTSNGGSRMAGLIPDAYADFARPIFTAFAQPSAVTTELDVADAVWRAANDASGRLRFPAGADAVALAQST
jgi:NAD(P)-dependent dehydrogenase (short-subunit alcohol dehydrogenase family)